MLMQQQQPAPDQEQPGEQRINDVRERLAKQSSARLLAFGLLGLPVLLLLNISLYRKLPSTHRSVRYSIAGCVALFLIWITWLAVFYSNASSNWAQTLYVAPVVSPS